jgi:hypothetical protein
MVLKTIVASPCSGQGSLRISCRLIWNIGTYSQNYTMVQPNIYIFVVLWFVNINFIFVIHFVRRI